MRRLAFLYGFALPFTSVLAMSGWLNLPSLLSMVILFAFLLKGGYGLKPFDVIVFATFVLPAFFSALANFHYALEEKFFSHLISYIFVFLAFYFVPRELLQMHAAPLLKGVVAGLVFSIIFAFAEFAVGLTFGYEPLSYIPRYAVNEYDAVFSGVLRVRSLVEESGHYALYLGVVTPIAIIFMMERWPKAISVTLIAAAFFAMILTFSTSGIAFLIASALVSILSLRVSVAKKIIQIAGLVVFFVVIYFIVLVFFNIDLENIITDKIDGMNGRQGPFEESWAYFQSGGILQIFFGLGPGYYAYRDLEPVISLLALMVFQSGIFGFILYIAMFIAAFKRVRVFGYKQRYLLMFSLLFAFLVYAGISNYWYPWLWFLLSVLSVGPFAFTSSLPKPQS